MASFNKVILIGNITADPELKQTMSGQSVCTFSIAVNRRFKDASGNTPCDFITIVAWRQQAEFVTRYFKKGKPILVCGQLQQRSYTDNQGQKRYAFEVVADELSFVAASEQDQPEAPSANAPAITPQSNGTQHGIVGAAYMPKAYTSGPSFEELPANNEEGLPF